MDFIITMILVFIVCFVAAYIGAMVGGGGLISIPALIFLGLPPQIAIATNKFGSLGLSMTAGYKYWKKGKVQKEYLLILSVLSIISTYFGTKLLLALNDQDLTMLVGWIVLLCLPFIFLNSAGTKRIKVSKEKRFVGYFLYFLAMVFGAFFGGGAAVFLFYILMVFFGFTIIEAGATLEVPWFLMAFLSVIIYAVNGMMNYSYGIVTLVAMMLGGYAGAHTAIEKGDFWVKRLFVTMVFAFAIKLIFF